MQNRQNQGYENLNKRIFDGVGKYDIPLLNPVKQQNIKSFIGFNFAKSCKEPQNKVIHFFLDDYQFSRLWNSPDKYLGLLKKFKAVLTPDFSMYSDFPEIIQIYNHYRKHWLGAYWQENGIHVIPTISWSDESSFEWCFDGEPIGGAVAVSSIGTQSSTTTKVMFLKGYNEMIKRLQPSLIYFYGKVPEGCTGNIVHFSAYQENFRTP